ncbi:pyridoxal phosphate-dependent aminotransferase [Candidatus Micrarchaeota archaeon]|nr:pyridoxal phosphate-dependent aminotransferase [Candidatus Micrarchaeota archaeon]
MTGPNDRLKVRGVGLLNVQTGSTGIKIYPLPDVNACAARVKQFGKAHEAKWAGKGGIIPLDLGDCETGDLNESVVRVRKDMAAKPLPYSPMGGEPKLREVIAGNLRTLFGVADAADTDLVIIPGSRHAGYAFSYIILSSFPSGQIGVINPSWATMSQQALMIGGPERLVEAELPYRPLSLFARLTPGALREFLEAHPQIIGLVLINPCNPTGHIATADEMLGFAKVIVDINKRGRPLFVHQDMTYGYVTLGNTVVPLEAVAQNLPEIDRNILLQHVITSLGLQKLLGSGSRVAAVFSKSREFIQSVTGVLGNIVGPVNKAAQLEAAAFYSDGDAIASANSEILRRRNALASVLEAARIRLRERHGSALFEHTLGEVALDRNTSTGGYYAVLRLHQTAVRHMQEMMGPQELTPERETEFFALYVGATVQPGATMRLEHDMRLAFGAATVEQIQLFGDRLVSAFM